MDMDLIADITMKIGFITFTLVATVGSGIAIFIAGVRTGACFLLALGAACIVGGILFAAALIATA
ncbi:MAG: hypothetical protein GXX90_03785 [Microbacteriaceae bacterium]|nr:hypothetical protein [Microbacteriaceae bacterium]